jgi:hypothetical protein
LTRLARQLGYSVATKASNREIAVIGRMSEAIGWLGMREIR